MKMDVSTAQHVGVGVGVGTRLRKMRESSWSTRRKAADGTVFRRPDI
jgi:hypothetical protein